MWYDVFDAFIAGLMWKKCFYSRIFTLLITVYVIIITLLSNVNSLSIFPCFFSNDRTWVQCSCRRNSATPWIIIIIHLLHRSGPGRCAEPLWGYHGFILIVFAQCLYYPCSFAMLLYFYKMSFFFPPFSPFISCDCS